MNIFEREQSTKGYTTKYWLGYYAAVEGCSSDFVDSPDFAAGYLAGMRVDRNVKAGKVRY